MRDVAWPSRALARLASFALVVAVDACCMASATCAGIKVSETMLKNEASC